MVLILLGKSASGKNVVCDELEKLGYHRMITYCTRPMRKGEVQDKTYHFISDEEFKQKIEERFFAEWKSYITAEGVWYYGSAKEDYELADDKTIVILTPAGYKDVIESLEHRPKSIYIYSNNATIQERLQNRGDDKAEAIRRIRHDNEDFKGVEELVDRIVYNNEGTDINNVVNIILQVLSDWEKGAR